MDSVNNHLKSIVYENGSLKVIDQLKLPTVLEYIDVNTVEDAFAVIRSMQVRGAPLIALVACLGLSVHLNAKQRVFADIQEAKSFILESITMLRESRPTAVNLFVATDELRSVVDTLCAKDSVTVTDLCAGVIATSEHMLANDLKDNVRMGDFGAEKILSLSGRDKVRVMTICNTGSLATGGYGTALGVVRSLHKLGRLEQVYALETRPYNQGARLTAFEIVEDGLPGTLITDSMAAALLSTRDIDCVVVGADRVAANGDTANKIGTLQLSIVANFFQVPVFAALPTTTLDLSLPNGTGIPVEERPPHELTSIFGQKLAPDGVNVWNPAFDVTPCSLIRGIITELGVAEALPGADGIIDMHAFILAKGEAGDNEMHLRGRAEKGVVPVAVHAGYHALSTAEIGTYLLAMPLMRARLGLACAGSIMSSEEEKDMATQLEIIEVGDGNLNLVYLVHGPGGSVVVKQALPYVRCVGEAWPLTLARADFEQAALVVQRAWDAEHVPEVYHFNRKLSMFVMQYIPPPHTILRKLLIAGGDMRPLTLASDLSTFLANTLFNTSALAMSGGHFRESVSKWSTNTAMCALTEQVIFSDPYNSAQYNHHNSPHLDEFAEAILKDDDLKAAVFVMKGKFLTSAQALVHGDMHSGSVMSTEKSTYVIDSEFAFYGPMGFDTGLMLANLIFAYLSQSGRKNDEQYSSWILHQTVVLFEEFERKFLCLWSDMEAACGGDFSQAELLRASPSPASERGIASKASYLQAVWRDTLGFAGAELIRRIVGIAHVEDLDGIESAEVRSICEKRCLVLARHLLLLAVGASESTSLPFHVERPRDLLETLEAVNKLDVLGYVWP